MEINRIGVDLAKNIFQLHGVVDRQGKTVWNRQLSSDKWLTVLYENVKSGSPWENGYNESFNGKLRDELLNTEMFYTLREAKTIIEQWRNHYNHRRPHSTLRYRPPAPQATISSLLPPITEKLNTVTC